MFYNNYSADGVRMETPEDKEYKRKQFVKMLSRLMIAFALYVLIIPFAEYGMSYIFGKIMTHDIFTKYSLQLVIPGLLAVIPRYFVAFPCLLLLLIGIKKSESTKNKRRMPVKDLILILCIAYLAMLIGSTVSSFISSVFNMSAGTSQNTGTDGTGTPIYLVFIYSCIIVPVFDELIFRKIIIDRVSVYGDNAAIIFSALMFAIAAGSTSGVLYYAVTGAVLAYIYTSTRRIGYSILAHSFISVFNYITPALYSIIEAKLPTFDVNTSFDAVDVLFNYSLSSLISSVEVGLMLGGIAALIYFIRNRKIGISKEKELFIPDKEIAKLSITNPGTIIFLVISVMVTVYNLL